MSLADLLYPSLALPRELRRKVPKLVVLAPDDFDDRGRELRQKELRRMAAQRRENELQYRRIKADPKRYAERKAETAAWRKANPERVAEYREKYRKTEAYRRYQREWRRRRALEQPGPGQARGELVGSAKLSEERVREMRAQYAAGGTSIAKVATKFSVSFSAAHKVINRLTWRHVA